MSYEELIFLDLKTSGLDPSCHQIIEVAAIDASTGAAFQKHVKFRRKGASPEALAKSNYNEKIWNKFAISQEEAFADFCEFLTQHAKTRMISKNGVEYSVAKIAVFNASFDSGFLDAWANDQAAFLPIDKRILDVMQLAFWTMPNLESYSLRNLADYFHIDYKNTDEAFDNALTNMKVTAKLLRELRQDVPQWARKILKGERNGKTLFKKTN